MYGIRLEWGKGTSKKSTYVMFTTSASFVLVFINKKKGMLDIISMIIFGFIIIGIFGYLMILGGSKTKTDYERKMDDEEQMKWIRENMK